MRRLSGALFTFLLSAVSLFAADELKFEPCRLPDALHTTVLVVDLRKYPTGDAVARFIEDDTTAAAQLRALLRACPHVDLGEANAFLDAVGKGGSNTARLTVSAPTTIRVYVFHQGSLVDIEVKEEKRNVEVVTDIGALIKLILAARTKAAPAAGAEISVFQADYALKEHRATVTFLAVIQGKATAENKAREDVLAVAVTGPVEHFRLSADVPVNTVKQLDYDKSAQAPKMKEVPREFLAGLGWYWGDVLKEYDYRTVGGWRSGAALRRLGVKGLLKFSNEPLNTVGLVGAFRGDNFSLFAGPIWNRQTRKMGTNPDGTDKTKDGYALAYRIGVGFDLSKALSWVKPKEDSKAKTSQSAGK